MIENIKAWPQKLKDGLDIAHNFHFEHSGALPTNINKIAFFGMGGSGIAGRMVKAFLEKESKIPFFIIDSPEVPAHIDGSTLAIVVSYSGNTWETVKAFNKLIDRHIPTVVISHNGEILRISEEKNILHMIVPESNTPRGALGYFLGMILGLLELMNLDSGKKILDDLIKHLDMYLPKLEDEGYYKEFIDLAKDKSFFHIWGVSGDSAEFAYRAQTQFNENSKTRAVFSSFPELNHNLLVGFTKLEDECKPFVIFFATSFVSPKVEVSIESLSEILKEQGASLYNPPILGDNWVEQLLHIVLWSDFASYYLGVARGQEVEPVFLIDRLKEKFAQKMGK
ncbi:SIS domain-containing protein [Candidatus Babeliales bacterium]|nr:SIS domain-containing protein [Candidatus Babeliales bacterium]